MDKIQLSMFNGDMHDRILKFRQSITPGFYSPQDIIPHDFIEQEIHKLMTAIIELDNFRASNGVNKSKFVDSLYNNPLIYHTIRLLLALPKNIGLSNGLELSEKLPDETTIGDFVLLLDEIDFWDLISRSSSVKDLVRVALIWSYAQRRPYRVLRNVEKKVQEIVSQSVKQISNSLNQQFKILAPESLSESYPFFEGTRSRSVRRGIDYVVAVEGKPISAIKVIFLTGIGGSQLRDLRTLYPDLQRELSTIPVQLVLIADGQGFVKIRDAILQDLFQSVHTVISINQAQKGYLTQALTRAATETVQRLTPIDRIIESILNSGNRVGIEDLPISHEQARIELAQFINVNPGLALTLAPGGELIYWTREDLVRRGIELNNSFNPRKALNLFCNTLDASLVSSEKSELGELGLVEVKPDSIIPEHFLVVSNDQEMNPELLKEVAKKSLQEVPNARLAVLVIPQDDSDTLAQSTRRSLQSVLSANIVTLDPSNLLDIIKSNKNPRDEFSSRVLEQSDLTKISPFVVNSATPSRMYYGREKEEATLLGTLATNSVAILGSRRIGKTSLLHHVTRSLKDSNFSAFFVDCQTVKDWCDFGHMAQRAWEVKLPKEFQPQHLFDLVVKLRKKSNQSIVILLDEIDQLLDWDIEHQQDQVPEAFFRTCRTLSQEGKAQFVFSGERTIARKLWDPHSPHWNFCRSLSLQQLDREATNNLIIQPLELLQIQISEIVSFRDIVWRLTSGHPQIAQYLGDKLVERLNEREPEDRSNLRNEDIQEIAETYEFKEHYVTTYWGQATNLEKLISLLITKGIGTPSEIIDKFQVAGLPDPERSVIDALKVLDLYGILRQKGNKYELRAEWFANALSAYGELTQLIERYWEKV